MNSAHNGTEVFFDNSLPGYIYNLGEEIANGVRFWGRERVAPDGTATAMMICPVCNELFRCNINKVGAGKVKRCEVCDAN